MNNKKVIDKINEFVETLEKQNPIFNDAVQFNLQDVTIEDAFKLNSMDFSEKATNAILDVLNVKPSFRKFQTIMEPQDWQVVSERLKTATGDVNLYGSVIANKDGSNTIQNIFFKNARKKKDDDLTTTKGLVAMITNELSISNVDWELYGISHDTETSKIRIELLNDNNPVEVLSGDFWKKGQSFEFNSTSFKQEPFFERLVCSNGMRRPQYGWKSNISKVSYTNEKLEKTIANALSNDNEELSQLITQFAEHTKANNISLREFYFYRKFYEKKGYDNILSKYFIEAPFYKAWGDNVCDKDDTWKATADSGINCYDFINLNTWIASHSEESGINKQDADDMKVRISFLFTAKELDMEKIAPAAQVTYPHFVEMD